MKEERYLIRLANNGHPPSAHESLLAEVRRQAAGLPGKFINLRVAPKALEFDLFCPPGTPLEPFLDAWRTLGERLTVKRLDVLAAPAFADVAVAEARRLFNDHRFWEVHEVLESLWKERSGPEKQLVQGLILAAAALVHAQKDEEPVAFKMLEDAVQRLENQPSPYYGWDVEKFRNHFSRVLAQSAIVIPTV